MGLRAWLALTLCVRLDYHPYVGQKRFIPSAVYIKCFILRFPFFLCSHLPRWRCRAARACFSFLIKPELWLLSVSPSFLPLFLSSCLSLSPQVLRVCLRRHWSSAPSVAPRSSEIPLSRSLSLRRTNEVCKFPNLQQQWPTTSTLPMAALMLSAGTLFRWAVYKV